MPSERELIAERKKKLEELREQGINPYPYVFSTSITSSALREKYERLKHEEKTDDKVSIAGRIVALRRMGKVTFAHLLDDDGRIQIYCSSKTTDNYGLLKLLDRGDWIGVQGIVFKTKTGEITIEVKEVTVLSKSLRPLPEKFHGLKDKETRYRKRYLDLIMNPDVKKVFLQRAVIINTVRNFLNHRSFVEVETPAIQALYGGTNARPFETYINAFDEKVYMRVAPELYLKRLVVGGFGKVYEIGKNFRNEGADHSHNPEFTMLEFYEAYADYHKMMDTAEELYKEIAQALYNSTKVPVGNDYVDLKGKWPRITMTDAISQHVGIDVLSMSEAELKDFLRKERIECRGTLSKGLMINAVFEKQVVPKLVSPQWIIDYPKEISPLAKPHREKEGFVERFECYIGGMEIGDGWSEIINPLEQRDRFEREQQAMRDGDTEAHPLDEDFIEALEYGMPVLGGIGIGIDRLTMFFTNNESIRDVMLFPFMKPLHEKEECFESPEYNPEVKQ
ncbi:lysine--tRNA ligase [Candidatus Woesearchaeota archaeon]|nr:lysine--tRNA ligase [Candidatus Woesearchaeota archaeon]